ncbi:MAG TPA: metallophosphoesterase [Clostridia bacterium]|nr:metallophosphoesterase [Clostridia bacterium]
MKIFALGDLHLGFAVNKPMDLFGPIWKDHHKKIKDDWYARVKNEDLVIIAGDTSWAMYYEDAKVDLEWIDALPGTKVIIKGNHDYWWQSLTKMQSYESIFFLHNNYYKAGDIAICGTRGWVLPGNDEFGMDDEKIYHREKLRLERSLDLAKKDPEIETIIVAMHYPPFYKYQKETYFSELLKDPMIKHVVYGHLHDKDSWSRAVQGLYDGSEYYLVSADYKNFKLEQLNIND